MSQAVVNLGLRAMIAWSSRSSEMRWKSRRGVYGVSRAAISSSVRSIARAATASSIWVVLLDVSVSVSDYAGDIGDAHPPVDPQVAVPLHLIGLARRGMPLIDGAEVEELAAVCAELGRFAFLRSIAPPRLRSATGVPVNPQAIF